MMNQIIWALTIPVTTSMHLSPPLLVRCSDVELLFLAGLNHYRVPVFDKASLYEIRIGVGGNQIL